MSRLSVGACKRNIRLKNSELSSLFLHVLIIARFAALALGLALVGCEARQSSQNQLVFTGPMMGTEFRVTLVVDENYANTELEALKASILNAMEEVNTSMSNYLPDSELSRFNRLGAGKKQTLSVDFARVMHEALSISKLSEGTFDVTLAKAIDAWGFGPNGTITKRPSAQHIDDLRASVGYEKLALDKNVMSKQVDEVEVNLSAIAKGYAVDKVAETLNQRGITNYLVNIGGELRASGRALDRQRWRVGIEKPHITGGIQRIVHLNNQAIATSGDYRNYLVIDGQQFSHTIDPKTLSPVYHKLALVSVISDSASTADALATALLAMDEERAWEFALDNDLAAYLVIRSQRDGEYETKITKKFSVNLQ